MLCWWLQWNHKPIQEGWRLSKTGMTNGSFSSHHPSLWPHWSWILWLTLHMVLQSSNRRSNSHPPWSSSNQQYLEITFPEFLGPLCLHAFFRPLYAYYSPQTISISKATLSTSIFLWSHMAARPTMCRGSPRSLTQGTLYFKWWHDHQLPQHMLPPLDRMEQKGVRPCGKPNWETWS